MRAAFIDTSQGKTLVLSGSSLDYAELLGAFLALAGKGANGSIRLSEAGLLKVDSRVDISIVKCNDRLGACWDAASQIVIWRLTADKLLDFADLLRPLSQESGSGHQYLEQSRDEFIVLASKGEYPASFLAR